MELTHKNSIIAEVISQALADPEYKKSLLADPAGTLKRQGYPLVDGDAVQVHHDTRSLKHVVVPVERLPESRQITSLPPAPTPYQMALWAITTVQGGGPLAEELVADPLQVLRGMGLAIPAGLGIQVLRNHSRLTHVVLPFQAGELQGDELSDEDLEAVAGGKGSSKPKAAVSGSTQGSSQLAVDDGVVAAAILIL